MQVDKVNVIAKLKALQQGAARDHGASVSVGYTQSYAIFVHENRKARHVVGRAGFLLDVARETMGEIARVISDAYAKGVGLLKSLLLGGLRLQRESQQNVPVDTGALRASAFTREDK